MYAVQHARVVGNHDDLVQTLDEARSMDLDAVFVAFSKIPSNVRHFAVKEVMCDAITSAFNDMRISLKDDRRNLLYVISFDDWSHLADYVQFWGSPRMKQHMRPVVFKVPMPHWTAADRVNESDVFAALRDAMRQHGMDDLADAVQRIVDAHCTRVSVTCDRQEIDDGGAHIERFIRSILKHAIIHCVELNGVDYDQVVLLCPFVANINQAMFVSCNRCIEGQDGGAIVRAHGNTKCIVTML